MSASRMPDAGAFGRQRQREVHRHRRLAHAALAGGHRDDVAHAGDELHRALHRVRDDLEAGVDGDLARRRAGLGSRPRPGRGPAPSTLFAG